MNFNEQENAKLEKLVLLYTTAKALILFTEELDPSSSSNLQIMKELRDAFDHLMQVLYSKYKKNKEGNSHDLNYETENLEKAIGHVYRAAFDALDGTVISLKELIAKTLSPYPTDVITEVMPGYWDMKREISKLVKDVSVHRGKKDITHDISDVLNGYIQDVENFHNIYE
jgi:hypothetical protein